LVFQAEDGIRDFHVTGVQTCALPILEIRATNRTKQSKPYLALLTITQTIKRLLLEKEAYSSAISMSPIAGETTKCSIMSRSTGLQEVQLTVHCSKKKLTTGQMLTYTWKFM